MPFLGSQALQPAVLLGPGCCDQRYKIRLAVTYQHGWRLGPILVNTFNEDLDDGMDCTGNKFVSDTRLGHTAVTLGGTAVTLEGRAPTQEDLCILDKRAHGDFRKFNKGKCRVLCQAWNNFTQQGRLETS